jgi:hypothetical protein
MNGLVLHAMTIKIISNLTELQYYSHVYFTTRQVTIC